MKTGDLVTWKLDVYSDKTPLEMGIVIRYSITNGKYDKCVWVKFVNGQHSHREKTLCGITNLVLVEDITLGDKN